MNNLVLLAHAIRPAETSCGRTANSDGRRRASGQQRRGRIVQGLLART